MAFVYLFVCLFVSQAPQPKQGGRALLSLREHSPTGPHVSFTFHWLWNSPQGSAGKGGNSLGIRFT